MIAWFKGLWRRFWSWWFWRKYVVRGKALDSIAFLNGISRRPGENDKRLRERIRQQLHSRQTPLGIADTIAQHIPGVPFRIDESDPCVVRFTVQARESDFDLDSLNAVIETVRPAWVRVIVDRVDP